MVPVFWSVCCYVCAMGCVMLCVFWLPEEPVIYVSFSWYVDVCVFGVVMCETRGIA